VADFAEGGAWEEGVGADFEDGGEWWEGGVGGGGPCAGFGFRGLGEEDEGSAAAGVRGGDDGAGGWGHACECEGGFDGVEVDEFAEDFDGAVGAAGEGERAAVEFGAVVGEEPAVGVER
jgi:hypothetical protein